MVLPKPWCTKDPRTSAKAIGLSEIFISVVGGVILVALPFVLLDIDHEIDYIKRHKHGIGGSIASAISPQNVFYTVNSTGTYSYDCNQLAQSMGEFLEEYLKGKAEYAIAINKTGIVSQVDPISNIAIQRVSCEIHVRTQINPRTYIVVVKNKKYSIVRILASCISKHTGNKEEDEEKKLEVVAPFNDQIAEQYIFPSPIGNDPERKDCINVKMRDVKKSKALGNENVMYHLLGISNVFSIISGFLLTSAGFTVSRILLMTAFVTEMTSIIFIIGAIILVNDSSLCLYQYGGISVYSEGTPRAMQTVLTYTCVIYAIVFKGYCLWFAAAFAEIAPSMKDEEEEQTSPDYSEYIADVALEVDKRNQELGGEDADIDMDFRAKDYDHVSDDEDENLNVTQTEESTREKSTTSKGASVSTKSRRSNGSDDMRVIRAPPPPKLKKSTDDFDDDDFMSEFSGKDHNLLPVKSKASVSNRSKSDVRRNKPKKFFGPTNTLVPQKRDKDLFANTFFGSNR